MRDILFENELALAIIVKNESPYIEEWIDYHFKLGVDKFYIYDNDSEDRSELQKILAPWIELGIVDYTIFDGILAQIPAYSDALKKHRFDCRYLMALDADEFLVPKNNRNLLDIFDEMFNLPIFNPDNLASRLLIAGFGINWRMFGSNGQDRKLEGGVIERFTKRARDDLKVNSHIKSVINPRMVDFFETPHHTSKYFNCVSINENGTILIRAFNPENTVEKIQINHYFTKSREEFENKIARGRPDEIKKRDMNEFPSGNWSEVEDLTALELSQRKFDRQWIPHSDELTIRDLNSMLDSDLTLEKLLTCFHRAHGLRDFETRKRFEDSIADKILNFHHISLREGQLFIDILPELIAARRDLKSCFIEQSIGLLEQLKIVTRNNSVWYPYHNYEREINLLRTLEHE